MPPAWTCVLSSPPQACNDSIGTMQKSTVGRATLTGALAHASSPPADAAIAEGHILKGNAAGYNAGYKSPKEPRPPPMPNLSNFLNPNNVFYHHTLTETYRNMSKQEKDELWMMDILMRQSGNSSNIDPSTFGTSPAFSLLKEAVASAATAVHAAATTTTAALPSKRHQVSNSTFSAATSQVPNSTLSAATWSPPTALLKPSPGMGVCSMLASNADTEAQALSFMLSSASTSSDMQQLESFYSTLTSPATGTDDVPTQRAVLASYPDEHTASAVVAAEIPLTTENLHTWAAVMLQLSGLLPETARNPTLDLVDVVLSSTRLEPEQCTGVPSMHAQQQHGSMRQSLPTVAAHNTGSGHSSPKGTFHGRHTPVRHPHIPSPAPAPSPIPHQGGPATLMTIATASLLTPPTYPGPISVFAKQQPARTMKNAAYMEPTEATVIAPRMAFANRLQQMIPAAPGRVFVQQPVTTLVQPPVATEVQVQPMPQHQPLLPVGPLSWG